MISVNVCCINRCLLKTSSRLSKFTQQTKNSAKLSSCPKLYKIFQELFGLKVLQFILQPNKETSTYFPTNIFLFHSKVEHFISKTTTAPLEKNELKVSLRKNVSRLLICLHFRTLAWLFLIQPLLPGWACFEFSEPCWEVSVPRHGNVLIFLLFCQFVNSWIEDEVTAGVAVDLVSVGNPSRKGKKPDSTNGAATWSK